VGLHRVPQGAVLSPLLFLFYINRARQAMPDDLSVSMYADDIAVWSTRVDKEEAAERVQHGVNTIHDWSKPMKLKLNPSKCEAGFFSSSTHESKWSPSVKLDGVTLTHNHTPKFLGVTYDRSLSFKDHVDAVCKAVTSKFRVLAALGHTTWGWKSRA
jgi:hypothetical protein